MGLVIGCIILVEAAVDLKLLNLQGTAQQGPLQTGALEPPLLPLPAIMLGNVSFLHGKERKAPHWLIKMDFSDFMILSFKC